MTNAVEPQTPRYPVRLVSLRTGLSAHVLRAWERRYRVVTPTRSEGGQRLYSDLDVERLLRLRRLTDRGHSIGRIASLPLAELDRLEKEPAGDEQRAGSANGQRGGPEARPESVNDLIEAALQAIRRLDGVELQAVLERAAVTLGVPVFIDEVMAPALVSIGQGWAERSVSISQEHLATAVFRRVLGWLFRVYEVRGTAPRLVVATPPSQVHELGALMVAASAAAEGWGVTYLGPDLPVADLVSAARQTGARAVAISVLHLPRGADLLATLRELRAGLPERVPLLVGGAAAIKLRSEAEAVGALVIESLPEFRALLHRLAEADAE